jgi:hypothetical protein
MHFSRLSFIVTCLTTTFAILTLAHVANAGDGSLQHVAVDTPGTTHQLWLVSTRRASSCPRLDQTSRLQYWRCDPDCQWSDSSLGEMLGSDDPEETTLIYVHENRVSESESFDRARVVFRQLVNVAPAEKRFRMIAVSWPSDRIGHRQRPDVKIKAQRSEAHGFYLAWFLDQLHPDVPVALFGDSFGPRMITASLHCLGGGSIQGQRLTERVHPTRKPVSAVLMAAAMDAHWLAPGQRHGLAMTQVEQMLVTVNNTDPALRFYPRMNGLFHRGADALGYAGPRCGHLGGKLVEWDVRCIVGPTHSWRAYEGSSLVMQQISPYLFGE